MRKTMMLLSVAAMALGACVGAIGDPAGNSGRGPTDKNPEGVTCDPNVAELTTSPVRRLAKVYFVNAVDEFLSTLGDSSRASLLASIQVRLDLVPDDVSDEGYATADNQVSQDHVDAVFGVATALATKISEDAGLSAELLAMCDPGIAPSALDDACLSAFFQHYGRKTLRRPPTDAEIEDFTAFYHTVQDKGMDAFAAIIARLIAHPDFYYRFDLEGDPADSPDTVYRLTNWELLSKITFLFWAAPPTDELYDFVEGTDITADDALQPLIEKVIADPKAERGILSFYRDWLRLDETQNPATEGNIAAGKALVQAAGLDALPETHRDDMIAEVLDLAKHYTLTTDGTLADILTSPYSFAKTPALAKIYGVAAWDGSPDHLVELPAGECSGLLTRAAIVASNSQYTRPILKGKFIRTRLLCTPMPPPPANLDIMPLTHPPDHTTRQDVEEATAAKNCQTCHGLMNPLGFLSENYDPVGRVRKVDLRFDDLTAEVQNQLAIDTRAVPRIEASDAIELEDAVALSQHLADSGLADDCMVSNYFAFVEGRPETASDKCDLVELHDELTGAGGSIKAMLAHRVLQPSFRQRRVK